MPQSEELTIAPGEGKQPMSILNDQYCEELAHPHLFPTGNIRYKIERNIKLSPVKYFNKRIINKSLQVMQTIYFLFCRLCNN